MLSTTPKKGEEMLDCGRLTRSDEKERALGVIDSFWVVSVGTDGTALPEDSPKASSW